MIAHGWKSFGQAARPLGGCGEAGYVLLARSAGAGHRPHRLQRRRLTLWLLSLGAEVWGYALAPEPGRALFIDLGLDQVTGNSDWGHLRHFLGDLCDLEALRRCVQEAQPEVVFHLAAQPLVRRSYHDPLATWATNVQGSLNLLEALKPLEHPCSVVMVTTDKVYANQEWDYGYPETDRLGSHDPYSASKAAAGWRSPTGVPASAAPARIRRLIWL